MTSPYRDGDEREALLSDTDTPFNTSNINSTILNRHEADPITITEYRWFDRFRRSTSAVIFVAAIALFT
jgi:hypothetical protein